MNQTTYTRKQYFSIFLLTYTKQSFLYSSRLNDITYNYGLCIQNQHVYIGITSNKINNLIIR